MTRSGPSRLFFLSGSALSGMMGDACRASRLVNQHLTDAGVTVAAVVSVPPVTDRTDVAVAVAPVTTVGAARLRRLLLVGQIKLDAPVAALATDLLSTDDLTTGGVKARFLGRVVLVDSAGLGTRAPMQRSGLPATGTFIPQWRCIRRTIRGIPSSQRKSRTVAINVLTNWGRARLWYAAKSLRRLLRAGPATSASSTSLIGAPGGGGPRTDDGNRHGIRHLRCGTLRHQDRHQRAHLTGSAVGEAHSPP
jgi:hypothetical protein